MAKKKTKRLGVPQKVIIVSVVLILSQVIYLALQQDNPNLFSDVVEKSLNKIPGLDQRRKDQLRVQLALKDYMSKNKGAPPSSLDKLRPDYFTSVPVDPFTKKPFTYEIRGGRPIVGELPEDKFAQAAGSSATAGSSAADLLAAASGAAVETVAFVYDPTGKRDPFRPFDFAPRPEDKNRTPLEKYDLKQLKLTAVLGAGDEAQAMVENAVGRGFTVKKGSKIGLHGGEVVEIRPDRIMILETLTDFTGEKKTHTIEMKLRTKDQERDELL